MSDRFADFIQAEESYSSEKEDILLYLESFVSSFQRISAKPDYLDEMISSLEEASAQLMNCAMDVTRTLLVEARESASKSAKIEYSLVKTKSHGGEVHLVRDLVESRKELDVSLQLTEFIRQVLIEFNLVKKHIEQLEREKASSQLEVDILKKNRNHANELMDQMVAVSKGVQDRHTKLEELVQMKLRLQDEDERNRLEREKYIQMKDELDMMILNNHNMVQKIADELFIQKGENEKRLSRLNTMIAIRKSIEEEQVELRTFAVDPPIDKFDEQEIRDEIRGLEADRKRYAEQINRIQEENFLSRLSHKSHTLI